MTTRAVDRLHRRIQDLDSLLAIEIGIADRKLVECALPGQVRLRQRRALVGQRRLIADENDLAGPPFLSKTGRELGSGMAGPPDDEGPM